MKIGNIRVLGENYADMWQRVYSNTIIETLDQQQTSYNRNTSLGDNGGVEVRRGQSFQLSATLQVSAVEIRQYETGTGSPSGNWTLRIETETAGKPSGTLADANATVTVTPPGASTIVKGTFATPFNLTAATTYWLVVQCDNQSNDVFWNISRQNSDTYANGHMDTCNNGTWAGESGEDLYFKIYTAGKVTSLTISGLDGNTAEEYILRCRFVGGSASAASYDVRLNNDTGANYGSQRILGVDTTNSAARVTNATAFRIAESSINQISHSTLDIYAKSGYVRTAQSTWVYDTVTTTVGGIFIYGYSWNNTADNITSIVVLASQTGGIGIGSNIELYARRNKVVI